MKFSRPLAIALPWMLSFNMTAEFAPFVVSVEFSQAV